MSDEEIIETLEPEIIETPCAFCQGTNSILIGWGDEGEELYGPCPEGHE